MKIEHLRYLWNFIKREVQFDILKDNPKLMIKALQKRGVDIADDVFIADPRTLKIDLTRPSLIKIGHYVRLNMNLEILTHDFTTMVIREKYHEFIPSSGRVIIGNNVYIGRNVTLLKGADIGDNCIIGYGSLVTKKIPSNSVAVGRPAKVICTLDEYLEKRKSICIDEAFDYAKSIQERYHRRPIPGDFREEFPLFVSGDQIGMYPEIPIKRQLGRAYHDWENTHEAPFHSFEEFLKAAGIE